MSSLAVAPTTIWGLGKVISLEHPEPRPTCVDLRARRKGRRGVGGVTAILEDGDDDQWLSAMGSVASPAWFVGPRPRKKGRSVWSMTLRASWRA